MLLVKNHAHVKIHNGENAKQGEFPWMVSLRTEGVHHCGASLIDDRWILTAAHCITDDRGNIDVDIEKMSAAAGSLFLDNQDNQEEVVLIEKLIPHPDYGPTFSMNDIALIKVQ